MDIDAVLSGIKGDIGKRIFFYDRVSSTNTVALGLDDRAEEGTIIIADSQEKGRGRFGRTWVSPPGANIYLSVILRPAVAARHLTLLTILSAVACAHAVRKTTGLAVSVKWPNDLMASDRKIGGILTEIRTVGNELPLAVVGIGMNVNMQARDFPVSILATATSLIRETGRSFHREGIISEILNEMDRWYKAFQAGLWETIIAEWQRFSSTLGREVLVKTDHDAFSGLAEAIDEKGLLIVRLPSGEMRKIASGDLFILQ